MEVYAALCAENVKRYRRKRGYTQAHLAELAGISRDALAHLERGKTNPTLRTLVLLAEALDIRPAQLLEQPDAEAAPDANSQT